QGDGWNRNRYDARNLTDYASRTVFDGKSLNWQVCDLRDVKSLTDEQLAAEVRELRRSPILYLTGRGELSLTEVQKSVLRGFVKARGTLVVECGDKAFEDNFRRASR